MAKKNDNKVPATEEPNVPGEGPVETTAATEHEQEVGGHDGEEVAGDKEDLKDEGNEEPAPQAVAQGQGPSKKTNVAKKNAPTKKPPIVDNGVRVNFQASFSLNTQLFDYRQIDSLLTKLRNRFEITESNNNNFRSWGAIPSHPDYSVEELKKKIIETYIEEALGVQGLSESDELADNVSFSEVMVFNVETFRISGKGSQHWGVLALTDASYQTDANGARFPVRDTYRHYHQTLEGEKSGKTENRRGLSSSEVCNGTHVSYFLPMVERGVVLAYRHVATIEKRPGYFVPQYEITKTFISRNTEGVFNSVSFTPVIEPKTLVQLVEDQVKNKNFRMNYYLEKDLCDITKWDLSIDVAPKTSKSFGPSHAGGARRPQQ